MLPSSLTNCRPSSPNKYPPFNYRFYFFLDLISTLSLLLDVEMINSAVLRGNTENRSAIGTVTLARAARVSKIGSRAGRILKIIRMLRLIRAIKLYKLKDGKYLKKKAKSQSFISDISLYSY